MGLWHGSSSLSAQHDGNKMRLYLNTMVFSIVAAVLSLMLLLLLLRGPPEARALSYMIITIEVGLLFVIVQAIVRIHLYERDLRKTAEKAQNNIVVVDGCPDYWTLSKRKKDMASVCSSRYVTPNTQSTIYVAAPSKINEIDDSDPSKKARVVNLTTMSQRPMRDVCKDLRTTYDGVSWSDLRNKCSAYGQSV